MLLSACLGLYWYTVFQVQGLKIWHGYMVRVNQGFAGEHYNLPIELYGLVFC